MFSQSPHGLKSRYRKEDLMPYFRESEESLCNSSQASGLFSCTLYLAGGNYPWHPWYFPNLPGFNSFSATAMPSLGNEQFPGKWAGLRSVPRRLGPFQVWTHDPLLQASPGHVLAPCWPSRLGISILIQLYFIFQNIRTSSSSRIVPSASPMHGLSRAAADLLVGDTFVL